MVRGRDGLQDQTTFFFKVDGLEGLSGARGGVVLGFGFLVRGLLGWTGLDGTGWFGG